MIAWENYTFCCDWMPGQTKYHACLHGEIDGQRVAFTGDNIFASATDPKQGGNEAVVARNGGALEEGYLYAANYLHNIAPDLLLGGHCWAIAKPKELIERMQERMLALRTYFQHLSTDADYRYMFDPYWVQAVPYRLSVKPGGTTECRILVRNYDKRPMKYRVALRAINGVTFEPAVLEGTVAAESTASLPVKIQVAAGSPEGLRIVALDITRDSIRHGELFDFLVHVGELPPDKIPAATPAKNDSKY